MRPWIFRKCTQVLPTLSAKEAVLFRYLAPEYSLLFKTTHERHNDPPIQHNVSEGPSDTARSWCMTGLKVNCAVYNTGILKCSRSIWWNSPEGTRRHWDVSSLRPRGRSTSLRASTSMLSCHGAGLAVFDLSSADTQRWAALSIGAALQGGYYHTTMPYWSL